MTDDTKTWTLTVLNDDPADLAVSVRVSESACPTVLDDDGEDVPDYGNADWPTDAEVSAEASRVLGRTVSLRFADACDGRLDEGLYRLRPVED